MKAVIGLALIMVAGLTWFGEPRWRSLVAPRTPPAPVPSAAPEPAPSAMRSAARALPITLRPAPVLRADVAPPPVMRAAPSLLAPSVPVLSAAPRSMPRVKIVFDPGHGGKDPGGLGRLTTDREVATAVALELKELLAADPRIEPVFTREDDRFVSLDERLAFGRTAGAVAFVSLHANVWHKSGRANGVEVAYASSRLARRELFGLIDARLAALAPAPAPSPAPAGAAAPELVAASDPATAVTGPLGIPILGAPVPPPPPPTIPLAEVAELARRQHTTIARSAQLARSLHDHLVAWTGQRARGTRPEGYRVLRPLETPAALIELGFLTDRSEEELMTTRAWQQRAARGIRDGLIAWLDTPTLPDPAMEAAAIADAVNAVSRRPAPRLADPLRAIKQGGLRPASARSPKPAVRREARAATASGSRAGR